MTIRTRFKIDHIAHDERHVGYVRDENGVEDRSKPSIDCSATVRLSAVEPVKDPERTHENNQVWKGRISGSLVLTNVDPTVAAGLKNGQEYFIDINPVDHG